MHKFTKTYSLLALFCFSITSLFLTACMPQTPKIENQPNLTSPNHTDTEVLVWAKKAVITTYTTNFVDYPKTSQVASQYFTPEGWIAYQTAFKKSGNLEAIMKNKLVVSAAATHPPIILNKDIKNNRYTWRVEMPVLVKYQAAYSTAYQPLVVNLEIVRTSQPPGSVKSLGIDSFIVLQNSDTKENAPYESSRGILRSEWKSQTTN